jgi:hypothetical protein
MALTRPVVLEAGERISARANALPSTARMYVMYAGWRFPAACLPSLLGVAGLTVSAAPTFDYSALASAAQDAAAKLATLAASVPAQD